MPRALLTEFCALLTEFCTFCWCVQPWLMCHTSRTSPVGVFFHHLSQSQADSLEAVVSACQHPVTEDMERRQCTPLPLPRSKNPCWPWEELAAGNI